MSRTYCCHIIFQLEPIFSGHRHSSLRYVELQLTTSLISSKIWWNPVRSFWLLWSPESNLGLFFWLVKWAYSSEVRVMHVKRTLFTNAHHVTSPFSEFSFLFHYLNNIWPTTWSRQVLKWTVINNYHFLEHGSIVDNTCKEEDDTLNCKFKCAENDNIHLLKNIVMVSII